MAKLKTETLTLKLVVNGDETRKKINDLETAVVNSRDSIKEMRKEMTSLAKQGQTDSARYKELTAAIKGENDAIKKNTAELAQLRSKLSLNDMTMKELAERAKKLRNELSRMKPDTKEWEQLNKDLKATSDRMRELGSGTKSTGGILEGLGKSVVPTFDVVQLGLKAIHAAGSILKKGLEDIVTDTQKFADVWEQEVAAAEAVWHNFIRRISASRDEITLTYQEVAKLAREAAALKDEIFEMQNSYNIREADSAIRMQELEATFRDTTLSVEERTAALNEMKELEISLAQDRLLIAQQAEDAAYIQFETETALDREAAQSFIENYLEAKKKGIVEAAQQYELLIGQEQYYQRVFESGAFLSNATYENLKRQQDEVRAKIAATSDEVRTFFETYRQYNLGEDTVTGAYAQAIVNTRQAQAAADESALNKKYVRLSGQLKRTPSGGSGGSSKKDDEERKRLEEERKAAQEVERELQEVARLEEQILQTRVAASDSYIERAEAQTAVENARFEKEMAQYEAKKDKLEDYDQIVETLQRRHNNNLLKIEMDRQSAELQEMETTHKLLLAQIEIEGKEKMQSQKEIDRKIAAENLRFLQQQAAFLESVVSTGQIGGMSLSMEMLDQYKLKLAELKKQLLELSDEGGKGGASSDKKDATFFGVSQSEWDTFFQHLKEGTLSMKDLENAATAAGEAAQEGFKLASQAIQLTNAKEKKALDDYKKGQDSRKKALEERYKAGLMTESQYNAEVEKMEADMQARQEEMELQQAQRTKTMSIVESIINTALAATKALASSGPPANIIMAGIVTALGAAQTAMIAAQPVGYAGGGYIVKRRQDGKQYDATYEPDKRGYVDEPTVLVGEEGDEYVIPAEALENPEIRMAADTIESARRSGRLQSLRMKDTGPAMSAPGRAEGGFVVKRRQDGKQYDAVYAPDKRGYVNGPTILVGEDGPEYVIPAEALENPQIRMVVDTIESARKSGRLRSLRMEAISPAMTVSGRAAGGYTSGAAPADMSVALSELDRMSETVDRLNAILENGIEANVSMLGPHGLVNKINEYNRAKNRGNLYDRDTNQIRTKSRSRSGR